MTITVFKNIDVEIPDEQAEYLKEYGNGGIIPAVYEGLMVHDGITPNTHSVDFISKTVQRLVSEEVEAAQVINDLWDKDLL